MAAVAVVFVIAWHYPMLKNVKSETAFCASVVWLNVAWSQKNMNSPEWWAWRWSAHFGLCEDENEIASGNSAYGALNLAFHIGFKHVALVGVDATQEPRVHSGGTPKNLSHLPLLFQSAREQIDVVSCGKMGGIPQMTLKEWLKNT
ncbi:hypothetical protein NO388_23280 [Escherichia coli]|nr:hypothetical protein [Escherichia coli]